MPLVQVYPCGLYLFSYYRRKALLPSITGVQWWTEYLVLYISNLDGEKSGFCIDDQGTGTGVVQGSQNTDLFFPPDLFYNIVYPRLC